MGDDGGAWTVRRLLQWTPGFFSKKGVDSPRLSAELLLAHVLGCTRIKLYTDYEREVTEPRLSQFRELVRRAAEHEPIAYLTGTAHFFNLEFHVTPDVLIPRPDTETLVENVLQTVRHEPGLESPRVLDLCTGSGCIAAAIATRLKTATVVAIDISPAAAAIARKNIESLGLSDRVTLETGDLFDPIARLIDPSPFQILTANPPYIRTADVAELERSVRAYEPIIALDGGSDGLDIHRRILTKAPDHLISGARLFLEIAFDQGAAALEMAEKHPRFEQPRLLKDHAGHDRVLSLIFQG